MTGFTLDASSLKRIGEQTRQAEFRPTELRDPHTGKHVPPGTVARFRLLTSLETGKYAAARRLVLEPTEVDGEYEWLTTDQEVPVFAGAVGWNNHWPDGAEVTCVATAAGWLVATDQLCGQFMGGEWEPIPYAILRIVQLTGLHRDTIQLGLPGTGDIAFWDDDYVVLGAQVPYSQREDPRPDEPRTTPRLRTIGCTPVLGQPVKIAYQPFDGLLPSGQPIPASILAAINQETHPRVGEIWGPTRHGKLARSLTFLELFWWEFCSPAWECRTFTVPNPDGNDPPTITREYWALPQECASTLGMNDHSGIPCDQPPPPRRSGFWISPYGWWGLGGWHWGWWGSVGWWRHPYGWWGSPGYGFYSGYFWGPWGHRWWVDRWGGRPPTSDDLLELPGDEPPPDPPCGGVLRRQRYGFVVWEYGWRVLGADQDAEVCTVVGEFEYRNRLVVEHPNVPESSCGGDYYG